MYPKKQSIYQLVNTIYTKYGTFLTLLDVYVDATKTRKQCKAKQIRKQNQRSILGLTFCSNICKKGVLKKWAFLSFPELKQNMACNIICFIRPLSQYSEQKIRLLPVLVYIFSSAIMTLIGRLRKLTWRWLWDLKGVSSGTGRNTGRPRLRLGLWKKQRTKIYNY